MTKKVPSSSTKVKAMSPSVEELLRKVKNGASLASHQPQQQKIVTASTCLLHDDIPPNQLNDYDCKSQTTSLLHQNTTSKHTTDHDDEIHSSSLTTQSCCSDDFSDTSSAIARDIVTITSVYDILLKEPRKHKSSKIQQATTGMILDVYQKASSLSKKRTASSSSTNSSAEKRNRLISPKHDSKPNLLGMEIETTIGCRKIICNKEDENYYESRSSDCLLVIPNSDDNLCTTSESVPSLKSPLQAIHHSTTSLCSNTLDVDEQEEEELDDDNDDNISAISIPNELPIPNDVTDYIRNCIIQLNDILSNVNIRHEQYNYKFYINMKEIEIQQNKMKCELQHQQLRLHLESQLLENELKFNV